MSDDIDYGKLTKKIVFVDNDHRHAQLLIKLRHDGLTQGDFFRHILTGYIVEDSHIRDYIEQIKTQSLKHKRASTRLRHRGVDNFKKLGFSDDELQGIFDIIEEDTTL